MSPKLGDLPNEVLQQVLYDLPPLSLPTIQLVNRRFSRLPDGLVWRHFCQTEFRYWRPEHKFNEKIAANVDDTDWKALFAERHLVDRQTTQTLDSILSSQMGRIDKIHQILAYGYDAKDCLLRHYNIGDDAEDVLARRFHSEAVLGGLQRTLAIQEWFKLQKGDIVSLERAISAYDMFILHERVGDFDEISLKFDDIAANIRQEVPGFFLMTTRQKSLSIVEYLRAQNLTGIDTAQNYHALQNSFVGIAICSESHQSLPLISVVIFCCVAQRLGLNAGACSYPFHVVAVVTPPPGFDLDGFAVQKNAELMYLDPFGSSCEILSTDLIKQLEDMRAARASYTNYIAAASVVDIVLRAGRNIINSVQDLHQRNLARQTVANADGRATTPPFPDLESAFYSALWASLLLSIQPNGDVSAGFQRQRDFLPHIIDQFEKNFPADVGLIEAYILPLFRSTPEFAQLRESIRVTRSVDSMPKSVKRRTSKISRSVLYKVGQAFTHRRYHYQAVITGWDVECGADENWMRQMRVHELSRGRQQSFYHVLVDDKSVRYVAEENIAPITGEASPSLMRLAGRYFKRWDSSSGCFISNIRDEYPDD